MRIRVIVIKQLLPVVLFLLAPMSLMARQSTVVYPEQLPPSCPIFYEPNPWFKWEQRYIYEVKNVGMEQEDTKKYSYMNGYGEFYNNVNTYDKEYKKYVWLNSINPEETEVSTLVRIQEFDDSGFRNEKGMTWYSKGMNKLIFDGEIIIFDYPLVLGKIWYSETTIKKVISVSFTGEVVAYIPANITSEADIIVAPGKKYKLPFPVKDIPLPMKEMGALEWDALTQKVALDEPERTVKWDAVLVPEGPHKDENITGYYVIQTTTKLAGITVMEQELWKDVRGYVPMYDTYKYFPLAIPKKHITKFAKVWTGTTGLTE